ncbi:hypothetical protein BTJ68_00414 [Hortaea werneckii EXF-2000]|uniref:Apple domain-containing protein n=1 Tax=Hortaea werneckii EXF-2000 TaxID=1157616 RepID=A0A1Z5TUE9_HORWE|nr:hypothetical protein KC358_g1442 [Hortaea werneckii]KAI7050307.1 hypothetical protein KC362_g746 [Hortaea werneckii]OTA39657.1 hypothetical protein BTJ68_00414 [Hortaea werneckii EXF-2000]
MCLLKPTLAWVALAAVAHAIPQQFDFNALAAAPTVASGPAPVDADGVETASLYTSFTVSGAVTPSETATLSAKRVRDLERRAPAPTEVTSVCTFTTPITSSNTGTPYYPALSTTSTTNPGLTGTTSAGQACATTPEDGTFCGFINPEDPCAPQPDGYGPVPSPDTASAFLAYPSLHAMASAAPTIIGSQCNTEYEQVFVDEDGSVSAQSYLGLYTLDSYDANLCAAKCDATNLCTAFNIYAERDPSLNPTKNDSTAPTVWGYDCPNPASMTSYKCTLWGSSIDGSLATNQGGYREDFHVVITASNGYDRTNSTIPPDPTGQVSSPVASSTTLATSPSPAGNSPAPAPKPATSPNHPWGNGNNCGGKAINAPQYNMGQRFFPGPFNPQVCSDYALAQNKAQSGSSSSCRMFNAAYLHKDGVPYGTMCSLYSSALDSNTWATYTGGQGYECKQSWTWNLI